jgi:hypothetical protein
MELMDITLLTLYSPPFVALTILHTSLLNLSIQNVSLSKTVDISTLPKLSSSSMIGLKFDSDNFLIQLSLFFDV